MSWILEAVKLLQLMKGKGKGKAKAKGKGQDKDSDTADGDAVKGHGGKDRQWGKGDAIKGSGSKDMQWGKGKAKGKGKGKHGGKGKGKKGKQKGVHNSEPEAAQALDQFHERNPRFKFKARRLPGILSLGSTRLS